MNTDNLHATAADVLHAAENPERISQAHSAPRDAAGRH